MSKPHRCTSNVFSMFNQAQIREFKEAFNLIDQNHDGFIDREDLVDVFTSLGKNPTDEFVDRMINDAPGPLNFTMFLTLFGEKMAGTDPDEVILNAFAFFDEKQTGKVCENRLREKMTSMGDRWTEEKVDELFQSAPIKKELFNYVDFVRTLKYGSKDETLSDIEASNTSIN